MDGSPPFLAWHHMLLNLAQILLLRASFFVRQRIEYQDLKNEFHEDWSRYYWSLQVQWPCNYNCSYCIQGFGINGGRRKLPKVKPVPAAQFLQLNQLLARTQKPMEKLVIQGGEPTLYEGLEEFLLGIKAFQKIHIVSNLSQPLERFMAAKKQRPDLEIKFIGSYHHEFAKRDEFITKAQMLREQDMLEYCDFVDLKLEDTLAQLEDFKRAGIPCRPYRYVGEKDGKIYPKKATAACDGKNVQTVDCMTRLVLIAPDAKVYNCHAKMYRGSGELCTLDQFPDGFRTGYLRCTEYGLCQPCQIDEMKVRNVG